MQIEDLAARITSSEEIRTPNRIGFSTIDSTNRVGKMMASAYRGCSDELPSVLLVALEQSRGRGRLGNQWLSPPGGLYASLVLPRVQRAHLTRLPMRVATTLCGYLDSVLESPCRVKWPNDLIVGQRKIGGILIESVQVGESVAAVIGFGINYSSDLPELAGTATTVVDESRSVPGIAEMLIPMVAALESEVDAEKSMESVVEEYAQWSLHEIGRDLVCRTARGMIRGKFLGFDPLGFLRLETESGEVLISAGEIVEGETRYES